MVKPIAILGAGSWGTALALHLSRLGQEVHLWSYDEAHAEKMQQDHANQKYLPGFPFPPSLKVFTSLEETITNCEDILIAVPSVGFRNTLNLLKPFLKKSARIILATKGLDQETGELLHHITKNTLGNHSLAVFSGPSYANEVASGLPTAVVIASEDEIFANHLVTRFKSPTFRPYLSKDVVGVEVGGAAKNVIAIAIGISDGMGFGANARSALITRGLSEIIRLGVALGAKHETFMGLSGIGDLILTCTDNQSRNRRFGLALGKGKTAIEAQKEINQVIEGKRNAELVVALAHKHHIEMPISECILEILKEKITLKEAFQSLLTRESKSEI